MTGPALAAPLQGMQAVQALVAQAPAPADNHLPAGETVLFWVLAPVLVVAALGLLFAKKAVHAALMLALVMIGLAVFYVTQGAHFLGAGQVVVYTGAVMMLFLFVLMLVGVDSSDSLVETIKGQRLIAFLAGLGLALLGIATVTGLVGGIFGVEKLEYPAPVGVEQANADGNPVGVARIIFSDYVVAMELTGALLITAAVGAIILTHRERLAPRRTQRELATRRVRDNVYVAGLPAPGVFARHNSVDTPALLPDGTPSELSVSRVLRARGQEMPATELGSPVAVVTEEIGSGIPWGRGLTGTQAPADERVDGTNQPVEQPALIDERQPTGHQEPEGDR